MPPLIAFVIALGATRLDPPLSAFRLVGRKGRVLRCSRCAAVSQSQPSLWRRCRSSRRVLHDNRAASWLMTSPDTPVGGSPHSTTKLFARNDPMTTSTRWPGFTARVGSRKAVRHARLRRAALAQLSYLLDLRDHRLDPGLRVEQLRLRLLIVEGGGFLRVQHPIFKSNELARLCPLFPQFPNVPDPLRNTFPLGAKRDSPESLAKRVLGALQEHSSGQLPRVWPALAPVCWWDSKTTGRHRLSARNRNGGRQKYCKQRPMNAERCLFQHFAFHFPPSPTRSMPPKL